MPGSTPGPGRPIILDMGRLRVVLLAVAAAGGCGWAARPYADDPLLLRGRGVPGGRARAPVDAHPGPIAPHPPPRATLGATIDSPEGA